MSYQPTRWNLTDLFPSPRSQELEQAFRTLEAQVTDFEKMRPQLRAGMSPKRFMEILALLEQSTRLVHKLSGFAELSFAADTQEKTIQALIGRIQQFLAELENRTLFFSLWWKDLDEAAVQRFLDRSGDVRYYLERIRAFKPHTLSEPEEKVINLKNVTGVSALNTLYDSLTNRYVFKLEVEGQVKELTRGELMVHARSSDPTLRANAYQELLRVYEQDSLILGQIYQALVRDWHNENLALRHFDSPIGARNLGNDIPDAAVQTLLTVCRKNAPIFQRYFRLKAKTLNLAHLRRYDIYAPVAKSDKVYTFDQAAEMVFDSLNSFHPDFAGLARRVFSENHLDGEVRKGKQDGAFCASILPEMTPWVKLNFQGQAQDIVTMAHELGHAIHSMLAADHSVFTFHASLPLAETASTFSEMMLVDRLLAEETDAAVRRDLLFRQVDDAYATILRQAYFSLFEQQAHELVNQNASVDDLARAYQETLREQFGEVVEVDERFQWEWTSIPHIFGVPFYVYAYAFGQLLVLALYQQYRAEGEAFKPRYRKILAAGGSEAPVKILSEASIDITSSAFWQGGFDVISGLIDQLESL
jgi:oligoendopeptidase F